MTVDSGTRISSAIPAEAPARSRKLLAFSVAAVLMVAAVATTVYMLHGRSGTKKIDSVAVLPFVNATSDPNNEYLSDGLTESLISTLSQLPDLKVMARSTVFRFKANQEDPHKIGQQLQVAAVLMGRITQHGDEVGVQADLVDTSDGAELWGSHYVRKAADITQVQSDITRDVSKRLRSLIARLWFEDDGQDIAEYAVMLAVILVIVVGTLRLIGSNANNAFSSVASSLH